MPSASVRSGASQDGLRAPLYYLPEMLRTLGVDLFVISQLVVAQSIVKRDSDASDNFFKKGLIPAFEIVVAPEDVAKLKSAPREYVKGRLFEGGKLAFDSIGVKLKGAAGSFREWDDRPALTIKVDKFDKSQTWRALKKFHLNNAVQDDTWQHDLLGWDLMSRAGIPAARVSHARVVLNGRDVGLYVLKEAIDSTFLARHFERPEGNLYDGGFCQDVDVDLERDSGDGPNDKSDLKAIREALAITDLKSKWESLGKLIDVKACVNFMAMELLINHWDGYTQNRNNYRLYRDPSTGKFVFIPHGMDQIFGDADAAVLDMPSSLVSNAVMRNPEWRLMYRKRLSELVGLLLPTDRMFSRIDEVRKRLAPVLELIDPKVAREYEGRVRGLKDRITGRMKFVKEQAALPEPKPLALSVGASAVLRTWRKAPETEDAKLLEVKAAGERQYLIGVGKSGQCVASWRKMVPLPKGKYRFSASLRTEGVVAVAAPVNFGAGIRVNGADRPVGVAGESTWKTVSFDFEVTEEARDVEFVLELRATRGSAWFNLDSLKLKRLG